MRAHGRDVVVCLVSDTFTDSVRRDFYSTADQLLLSLVASDDIRRVLVVDHPRGVLSQLKRRRVGDRPAPRSGKLRGLRPWTLSTPAPTDVPALERRYLAFDLQIAAAISYYGLNSPSLITFNLFHAGFGSTQRYDQRMFYAQDDEAAIPRLAEHRALIDSAYRRLASTFPVVAAVSGELLGRIAPEHAGMVVTNGVDPELWRRLPPRHAGPGSGNALPVAAYAGTIDGRLDVEALEQLAANGFKVMLAGPVADPAVGERLARTAELLGTLSRADITTLLVNADVCVLPHRRSPLTEAMSPLKLFEYVASGTPVIATDLAGVREAWPGGMLVPTGGDYASAALRAIGGGRLSETDRQRWVTGASWRSRHHAIIDFLVHDRNAVWSAAI